MDGQLSLFDGWLSHPPEEKTFEDMQKQLEERIKVVKLDNPVKAFHGYELMKTQYGCLIDGLFLANVIDCCLFEFQLNNPISNAGFGIYKKEDIGSYEVLEDEKVILIPRYAKSCDGEKEKVYFTHYRVNFNMQPMVERLKD